MTVIVLLIVNVVGLALMAAVAYWFWHVPKGKAVEVGKEAVTIEVKNGLYTPDRIQAKVGQTVMLRFLRTERNPCAGTVMFPDFEKSAELPLDREVDLQFVPDRAGEFEFTCQMGMYRGKLIVTE